MSQMGRSRHIVAMGGLRAQPGVRPPIVSYVLGLTGKARPKVCLIPTAKGDQAESIVTELRAFWTFAARQFAAVNSLAILAVLDDGVLCRLAIERIDFLRGVAPVVRVVEHVEQLGNERRAPRAAELQVFRHAQVDLVQRQAQERVPGDHHP